MAALGILNGCATHAAKTQATIEPLPTPKPASTVVLHHHDERGEAASPPPTEKASCGAKSACSGALVVRQRSDVRQDEDAKQIE